MSISFLLAPPLRISSCTLGIAAAVVMLGAAGIAEAKVIYRGIGNDEFSADIDTMWDCLDSCLGPADLDLRVKDRTGAQICAHVTADAALCSSGDIYIFHYAGHGSLQPANNPPEDPNGDDETIGLSGTGLTDDELAACFLNFPSHCTVLVIMDSCFGGGFVGGDDDLDRAGIDAKDHLSMLATASKFCTAPGESVLLQDLCDGLDADGAGSVNADANGDGKLTMTEWFTHAANDILNVENYYDWNAMHDAMELWARPPVPALTLPGQLALTMCLIGAAAGRGLWRSRRR
jgi:hypothetical protein